MAIQWCDVCDFSKPDDGPCPTCAERAKVKRLEAMAQRSLDIERLGGEKAYREYTLEKYDRKELIDACAGFPNRNLYLWGATGVGKTHLAVALVRAALTGLVIKPQQIYREMRGFKTPGEEERVLRSYINRVPLVIDEAGIGHDTEFSYTALYEVIDGRDMAGKKGLIITSNLPLDLLAQKFKDDRVTSRIAGLCGKQGVIEITGTDRRMK